MSYLVYAALLLVLLGVLAVRWVPAGECLVVLRRNQVRRVVGPGLTALDPIRDHSSRFVLDPQDLPLVIHAVTRDEREVLVLARLSFQISDPGVAAHTAVDPATITAQVAEDVAASLLAGLSSADLHRIPATTLDQLLAAVNLRCALWGVTVHDIAIEEVDLRLVTP